MDKGIQQRIEKPMVSIVILNWNGYNDTIECLASLSQCINENFEIILVDNDSSDGSIGIIEKWIADAVVPNAGKKFKIVKSNSDFINDSSFIPVHILVNSENLGFAKGNNTGIALAIEHNAAYTLLLNNDTVVSENFLSVLLNFFENHSEYSVVTPQIRYYDKHNIIWNCGGTLSNFGSRKYFFNDKPATDLPAKDFLRISFITGCALMIKTELIRKIGMLSEDFFFGEEDFEYSLRLRKNKINVACVLRSLIYHKVNSSISRTSEFAIGKIYVHYLNRFIDMRNFMPFWKWRLWRFLYQFYIIFLLLFRHKISFRITRKFLRSLMENSSALKGVSKAVFDKYINFDFS
jgi:hypothetical protein